MFHGSFTPGTVSLPRSKSAAAAKTRPRALGAPPGARGWSRQQRSPVSQGWSPPEGEVVPSSPPGMCLSGFLSLSPPPPARVTQHICRRDTVIVPANSAVWPRPAEPWLPCNWTIQTEIICSWKQDTAF